MADGCDGRTVAVTGCGVVVPNGVGRSEFSAALREGRKSIGDLVSFDASDSGRERAAEILDFEPGPYLRSPKNYLDRNSALTFAACEMAVRESGLALDRPDPRHGVSLGSMAGNIETLALFHANVEEKGPRFAPPFLFPHTYYNATAGLLSIEYGLAGPHEQFCSGGAASLEAVAKAARCVADERADVMIAGGAEAFSEHLFRYALARGLLSPVDGGEECCRPFAADRNGTILGEGAAVIVIEAESPALKRNANVLARILGTGTARTPAAAMARALADAELDPARIDAVFAAAGGYVEDDEAEAEAIRRMFAGRDVPVAAVKSLLGETLGASGALNLAAALCAVETGALPPRTVAGPEFGEGTLSEHGLGVVLVNAGNQTGGICASVLLQAV